MRRFTKNRDELERAHEMRETFVDRPPSKETQVPWEWPETMVYVGDCEGIMYVSDKWKKRRGDTEDYKHIAEADQYVLVPEGFLHDYHTGEPLDMEGEPMVLAPDMPQAFAELADIYGVQIRFLEGEIHEVQIAKAKLGGAYHKDFGPFVFVYNDDGVHIIICGEELAIEKDGITG